METRNAASVNVGGQAMTTGKIEAASVAVKHNYLFEARDKDGKIKWTVEEDNIVPNEGLDEILDKFYKGSSYTASHFVGLTDGTPTVNAADTMASAAGWSEVTAYDEGTRQAFTPGTVSSQSVDNSASKAVFTISTNGTTIGGGFLTTNNTKGGTSGELVSVVAFTAGDKSLDDGDTLSVTVTATMATA
jgi:hypothetical protein